MELAADAAALGIELEAIEIENDLEWAEAQGRAADAEMLTLRLAAKLYELADVVDVAFTQPTADIHAHQAA
jgi:hypothetical protein